MEEPSGEESRRARERGADAREAWEKARRARSASIGDSPDPEAGDPRGERPRAGDDAAGRDAGGGDAGGGDFGGGRDRKGGLGAISGEGGSRRHNRPKTPDVWNELDEQTERIEPADWHDPTESGGDGPTPWPEPVDAEPIPERAGEAHGADPFAWLAPSGAADTQPPSGTDPARAAGEEPNRRAGEVWPANAAHRPAPEDGTEPPPEGETRPGWKAWERKAGGRDAGRERDAGSGPGAGDGTDDGAEPPLPTEPGGSGRLNPHPSSSVTPDDQVVWADEPVRAARTQTRARPRAGAGAPSGAAVTVETGRRPAPGRGTRVGRAGGGRAGRRVPGRRARGPSAVGRWWRRVRPDVLAVIVYAVGAVHVLAQLLPNPGGRVQANVNDQVFFQWVLAYGGRVVSHGDNPLVTTRLNAPVGVNMMANTSVLGISLPLSPVTLLFGSAVTYAVFAVVALAATATAWYYVLSRHVVRSRMAAGVGGGLAGFAPAMISHSYGHPNIVAQFLVPFIVWRTIRLRERGRALRSGIALGLLVIWQAFINEEVLLITAIGLIIFVLSYAAMRPSVVRRDALPFLRGLLVAVVLAGALLAYPLYIEFAGPQHSTGVNTAGPLPYPADVLSFPGFSSSSLAGSPTVVGRLAQNISEQNAFFGWPLLVLLGIMIWVMRRSRVYLAGCVVVLVLTALSLGSRVTVGGRGTRFEGPWDLVADLPLFRQVVPTRVAVDIAPVLAVLLALAYDRVAAINARDRLGPGNLVWHGALIAVLVPLAPVPLRTTDLPPVPPFITQGVWQQYVDDDHSLVGVPSAALNRLEPMRWSAITNAGFAIPGGYYLAPNGAFGSPPRATSTLLDNAAGTGRVPPIGPRQAADAVSDLRFWRASVVVVVPGFHTDAAVETGSELFGFRPRYQDGLWLWDVRDLVAGR